MTTATTVPSYTDFRRFDGLRTQAHGNAEAGLAKVAQEFEALFIQMMLKAARDASPAESEFNTHEAKLYREMFDNQIALTMAAEGRLGIAAILRQQIPLAAAVNDKPLALELPERRLFPAPTSAYAPVPKPEVVDEVVDISSWQARVTNRAFADHERTFTAKLLADAKRAADKLGTTPEILVAQAALETGWGRHVMSGQDGQSSHNLFGIKADPSWEGSTVNQRTLEFYDGRPVRVSAAFRAYPDFGAAFDDYARFIQDNPRYQYALARAEDPRAYVQALQSAGYATDPQYAHKILRIHDQIAALTTHVPATEQ